MKSVIVSYTLEKAKPHQKIIIHRLLYGYNDLSNNMAYRYKRKGLIDKYSGKKINRGVFIIPERYKTEVVSILKKNNASFHIIPIVLH